MVPSLTHGPAFAALMAVARDRSPVEELQCHALLGLLETCESLNHCLKRELTRHAHTTTGFSTLGHLLHHDAGLTTPAALAEALHLPRQTIGTILIRLEMSGLITHARVRGSRRVQTIQVTTAGRQAFTSALWHYLESITRLMSPLDSGELATLDLTCTRLREFSSQLPNS